MAVRTEEQIAPITDASLIPVASATSATTSHVGRASIIATVVSTLLVRIAGRTSFVVLSFYLGEHFDKAALVVGVIESYYVSELLAAPIIGSLSDRRGRKPFLLGAPLIGMGAAAVFLVAAIVGGQHPNPDHVDFALIAMLALILVGRLLEGLATAFNTPATLGYITDATIGSDKLRARFVTLFEVATVGGIALAIPFGGQVSSILGTTGFLVVIGLHIATFLVIWVWMKESLIDKHEDSGHGVPLTESLGLLRYKQIATFIPAWLAINALVGAWLVLITIMLAYPATGTTIAENADLRHPAQLLYGGFSKEGASRLVGVYGLVFLLGMGGWSFILPRFRRTTVMLIGLGGLILSCIAGTIVNGLANNPRDLTSGDFTVIFGVLPFAVLGVVLLSGFTPAALLQMGAISETLPNKRGAVAGLYSVILGVGQLVGSFIGAYFVDAGGFYGLMIFSVLLGSMSFASVLYVRSHNHDLLTTHGH